MFESRLFSTSSTVTDRRRSMGSPTWQGSVNGEGGRLLCAIFDFILSILSEKNCINEEHSLAQSAV